MAITNRQYKKKSLIWFELLPETIAKMIRLRCQRPRQTLTTTILTCIVKLRIQQSEYTESERDKYYIWYSFSNWQTFAHFLKASIGTGVLAMPSAFAHAGYVNGFVLTAIIGLLALYCLHILVSLAYCLSWCQLTYLPFADQQHVYTLQASACALH